jgi:hypothetical protein
MGTQGLCARMRVGTLAGGRRGRRVIAPFVVSIGLLPALVGCSSFSSTSSSRPDSVGSTPSSPPAAAGPVTARGGVTVGPPPSGPYSYDESGPSGILVDVFRHNSTPPAQTGAMPPAQTGTMPPAQTAAMAAPPSVPTSYSQPAYAGPSSARGGVTVGPPPSGPATEDTGPSGLLANIFRSNSTPSAAPSNMPHPPSTYTASAPPYTPPPGQAAPPAPPPANSAQ